MNTSKLQIIPYRSKKLCRDTDAKDGTNYSLRHIHQQEIINLLCGQDSIFNKMIYGRLFVMYSLS